MGHYSEDYAHDEEVNRQARKKANKKAESFIQQAIQVAQPAHEENFRSRLKEAILWLEETP